MTYTPDDFRYDTPPRIMGSETEYTTDCVPSNWDLTPFISAEVESGFNGGHSDNWLGNGSRVYLEYGELIEYATPEVTSATSLLAYERTGETIVTEIAQNVIDDPDEDFTVRPSTGVFKRTGYAPVDRGSNTPPIVKMSTGHHENYITPLRINVVRKSQSASYAMKAAEAYLASRPVWSGSGIVTPNGYELSQKANMIDFYSLKEVGDGEKTPLNTKGDGEALLKRLEIRTGEGNMSEWAIIQKFAFTSLVIRLIEHGKFPESLFLRNGYGNDAMRRASQRRKIMTIQEKMDAATHQRRIAEIALSFANKYPNTPLEEKVAAQEVALACEQIEQIDEDWNGVSVVSDRVDWAAKLDFMRVLGTDTISMDNLQAVYFDLQWENLFGQSIAEAWYKKYGRTSVLSPLALERARVVPPPTRALARTSFLASHKKHIHIDWHKVEVPGSEPHYFTDAYSPTI